jgi:tape measure domain-containing protein
MATERLIVELDAQTKKFDSKLASTNTKMNKLDNSVTKTDKSLSGFSKTAKAAGIAIGALATSMALGAFTRYADQIQNAENQLRTVTQSTKEFNAVQDELRRIAIETRQSLNDLTSVYARFKRAGDEAGFTIQETLDLTESLTKAFKIEGNTTAEVNSVLLQLTQSFRSGRIAGEEFRALSEGSTIALRALSAELGVSTGELKEMAAQGLITPQALIAGLQGAEKEIDKQFAALAPTFSDVGAGMGRVFTAAFDNSIADSTSGKLKSMLLDMGADIERFFTGKESLTESGLERRIDKISEKVLRLRTEFSALSDEDKKGAFFLLKRTEIANHELDGYIERLSQLQNSTALEMSITGGGEDPRIQQERDFIEQVLEIQSQKFVTDEDRFHQEVAIHKAALDNKLINEREYQKAVNESSLSYVKSQESETGANKKATAVKLTQQQAGIRAGMALNTLLFEDNKAIAAGLIIADTAAGIMKTIATMGMPAAIPFVALTAATGAAQLANALSATKGGGGGISGTSGSSNVNTQENFEAETSSLELSNASDSGSSSNTIKFATDSGDELMDTIAKLLNKGKQEGRFV